MSSCVVLFFPPRLAYCTTSFVLNLQHNLEAISILVKREAASLKPDKGKEPLAFQEGSGEEAWEKGGAEPLTNDLRG